ncbi:periplasmic divalent cation tolerance protein [Luteibacter sp. Sphag1AF]|uniref:divalent-cation tolerance protein CutA n=1 Tax=Luteibacter sp. Sphag1AF TaxID=2587031 RepID=UPI0016104B35|nr:divalent-cation tolerance protein CutA [Luteibacter sp. Sphag1AF]MBB3226118.1 periplasmic divalent cation tolerance protein [Luteibacter sp. Sphag1AF]
MTSAIVILTACPDATVANDLARELVEAGLAACVSRVPGIASTYRWKGVVVTESEELLVIKATREAFTAIEHLIVARHPYDVPEIIALPIEAAHAPYLAWLREGSRDDPSPAS